MANANGFASACSDVIGREHVLDAPADLDHWARTTLHVGTRPCTIARPADTAAVQRVVALAAAHGLPVHPVSRGRNWGYGDVCAPHD